MTDHYGDQNVSSKQLVQPDNLKTGKEKKWKQNLVNHRE